MWAGFVSQLKNEIALGISSFDRGSSDGHDESEAEGADDSRQANQTSAGTGYSCARDVLSQSQKLIRTSFPFLPYDGYTVLSVLARDPDVRFWVGTEHIVCCGVAIELVEQLFPANVVGKAADATGEEKDGQRIMVQDKREKASRKKGVDIDTVSLSVTDACFLRVIGAPHMSISTLDCLVLRRLARAGSRGMTQEELFAIDEVKTQSASLTSLLRGRLLERGLCRTVTFLHFNAVVAKLGGGTSTDSASHQKKPRQQTGGGGGELPKTLRVVRWYLSQYCPSAASLLLGQCNGGVADVIVFHSLRRRLTEKVEKKMRKTEGRLALLRQRSLEEAPDGVQHSEYPHEGGADQLSSQQQNIGKSCSRTGGVCIDGVAVHQTFLFKTLYGMYCSEEASTKSARRLAQQRMKKVFLSVLGSCPNLVRVSPQGTRNVVWRWLDRAAPLVSSADTKTGRQAKLIKKEERCAEEADEQQAITTSSSSEQESSGNSSDEEYGTERKSGKRKVAPPAGADGTATKADAVDGAAAVMPQLEFNSKLPFYQQVHHQIVVDGMIVPQTAVTPEEGTELRTRMQILKNAAGVEVGKHRWFTGSTTQTWFYEPSADVVAALEYTSSSSANQSDGDGEEPSRDQKKVAPKPGAQHNHQRRQLFQKGLEPGFVLERALAENGNVLRLRDVLKLVDRKFFVKHSKASGGRITVSAFRPQPKAPISDGEESGDDAAAAAKTPAVVARRSVHVVLLDRTLESLTEEEKTTLQKRRQLTPGSPQSKRSKGRKRQRRHRGSDDSSSVGEGSSSDEEEVVGRGRRRRRHLHERNRRGGSVSFSSTDEDDDEHLERKGVVEKTWKIDAAARENAFYEDNYWIAANGTVAKFLSIRLFRFHVALYHIAVSKGNDPPIVTTSSAAAELDSSNSNKCMRPADDTVGLLLSFSLILRRLTLGTLAICVGLPLDLDDIAPSDWSCYLEDLRPSLKSRLASRIVNFTRSIAERVGRLLLVLESEYGLVSYNPSESEFVTLWLQKPAVNVDTAAQESNTEKPLKQKSTSRAGFSFVATPAAAEAHEASAPEQEQEQDKLRSPTSTVSVSHLVVQFWTAKIYEHIRRRRPTDDEKEAAGEAKTELFAFTALNEAEEGDDERQGRGAGPHQLIGAGCLTLLPQVRLTLEAIAAKVGRMSIVQYRALAAQLGTTFSILVRFFEVYQGVMPELREDSGGARTAGDVSLKKPRPRGKKSGQSTYRSGDKPKPLIAGMLGFNIPVIGPIFKKKLKDRLTDDTRSLQVRCQEQIDLLERYFASRDPTAASTELFSTTLPEVCQALRLGSRVVKNFRESAPQVLHFSSRMLCVERELAALCSGEAEGSVSAPTVDISGFVLTKLRESFDEIFLYAATPSLPADALSLAECAAKRHNSLAERRRAENTKNTSDERARRLPHPYSLLAMREQATEEALKAILFSDTRFYNPTEAMDLAARFSVEERQSAVNRLLDRSDPFLRTLTKKSRSASSEYRLRGLGVEHKKEGFCCPKAIGWDKWMESSMVDAFAPTPAPVPAPAVAGTGNTGGGTVAVNIEDNWDGREDGGGTTMRFLHDLSLGKASAEFNRKTKPAAVVNVAAGEGSSVPLPNENGNQEPRGNDKLPGAQASVIGNTEGDDDGARATLPLLFRQQGTHGGQVSVGDVPFLDTTLHFERDCHSATLPSSARDVSPLLSALDTPLLNESFHSLRKASTCTTGRSTVGCSIETEHSGASGGTGTKPSTDTTRKRPREDAKDDGSDDVMTAAVGGEALVSNEDDLLTLGNSIPQFLESISTRSAECGVDLPTTLLSPSSCWSLLLGSKQIAAAAAGGMPPRAGANDEEGSESVSKLTKEELVSDEAAIRRHVLEVVDVPLPVDLFPQQAEGSSSEAAHTTLINQELAATVVFKTRNEVVSSVATAVRLPPAIIDSVVTLMCRNDSGRGKPADGGLVSVKVHREEEEGGVPPRASAKTVDNGEVLLTVATARLSGLLHPTASPSSSPTIEPPPSPSLPSAPTNGTDDNPPPPSPVMSVMLGPPVTVSARKNLTLLRDTADAGDVQQRVPSASSPSSRSDCLITATRHLNGAANVPMLRTVAAAIVDTVTAYPGIDHATLSAKLSAGNLISRAVFESILERWIDSGCILRRSALTLATPQPAGLVGPGSVAGSCSNHRCCYWLAPQSLLRGNLVSSIDAVARAAA